MADPFASEKEALRLDCEKAERTHRLHLEQLRNVTQDSWFFPKKWQNAGVDVKESELPLKLQFDLRKRTKIDSGKFGAVYQTTCYGIPIVMKRIGTTTNDLNTIRDEAKRAQSLTAFRHIVKLVGAFSKTYDAYEAKFNILYFPVADCNLETFLDDFESTMKQNHSGDGDVYGMSAKSPLSFSSPAFDPYRKLMVAANTGALPYPDGEASLTGAMFECSLQIQQFLREAMGCIARAIHWMHSKQVTHQDIKPANILLRNGQLYVTDFGISQDRRHKDAETESIWGSTLGYRAPQVEQQVMHDVYKDDMYALGCVFMHIVTTAYWKDCDNWGREVCKKHLQASPDKREGLIEEYFGSEPLPEHELIKSLLSTEYKPRRCIDCTISDLQDLAKAEEKDYYGKCCMKNHHLQPSQPGKHRVFCKKCIESTGKVDGDAICYRCGHIRYRKRLYCTHCDASIKGVICERARCSARARCERCDIEIPQGRCRKKCGATRVSSRRL